MTRTAIVCVGTAAVVGLLLPAPARAQNRAEQQMRLDVRLLQEQQQQLLLVVNTLAAELKTVAAKLDTEGTARSKGFADLQTQVNTVGSNVSALLENVRDNKVQVTKVSQELDAIRKGVDILTTLVTQTMAQLPATSNGSAPAPGTAGGAQADNAPQGGTAAPGAAATPPPAAAAATSPVGGVPASADDYFKAAMGDYAAGQYDMAISGFQEFLKRFGDSPDAAKAQFYIGEADSYLAKWQDAIDAYGLVIQNYKASDADTVADAYFNQGLGYEQLHQKDQAIANYRLLQKSYAGTNGALQATQALKRLNVIN